MLSKDMEKALNEQIQAEVYSGYLYISMSAYFESQNLKGMANWMSVQAQEEFAHAQKFYHFILERGGKIELMQIDAPPADFKSAEQIFNEAYKHEQKVTARIHALLDRAIEEKDHATNAMLQWFVTEQVEEESSASEVLEKVKLAGSHPSGIFMIDQELGKRVFTPPAP